VVLGQQVGGADDGVQRGPELVAHIAHEPGLGRRGDLGFLFFGIQQAQDEVERKTITRIKFMMTFNTR
jgi:hypothetical protein